MDYVSSHALKQSRIVFFVSFFEAMGLQRSMLVFSVMLLICLNSGLFGVAEARALPLINQESKFYLINKLLYF